MTQVPKVFACSNGPWQAIVLYSSLRQAGVDPHRVSVILVCPKVSLELRQVHQAIVGELFGGYLLDLGEVFDEESVNFNYGYCRDRLNKSLSSLNSDGCLVWLSSIFNWRETCIASILNPRSVYLYDDGMKSLINRSRSILDRSREVIALVRRDAISAWKTTKPLRYVLLIFPGLWLKFQVKQRLKRLVVASFSLQNVIGGPEGSKGVISRETVAGHLVCAAIRKLAVRLPDFAPFAFNVEASSRKLAVFVGQCFSRYDIMSEKQELELYLIVLERLCGYGYLVFWKEHPRSGGLFYRRIREMRPDLSISMYPGSPSLPIEIGLLSDYWEDAIVVGVVSSSLLYLKTFFDRDCYTCFHYFESFLDKQHRTMISSLAGIPTVESLSSRLGDK